MPNMVPADNLGGLPRSDCLLKAQAADLTEEELRAIEGPPIAEAIRFQEGVGLPIVTDGECRRHSFATVEILADGIDGRGFARHYGGEQGVQHGLLTPTPTGRLTRKSTLAEYERNLVRPPTDTLVKVTTPSPRLLTDDSIQRWSGAAYSTREHYLEHLIELMNEDPKALVVHGADHIQLDAPHNAYIPKLIDVEDDRNATLHGLVDADNRALEYVEAAAAALHVCRENDRSHFTGTQPYDDLTTAISAHASAKRLQLEYGDERSGGFNPLHNACDNEEGVLGLVTTERADMASADELNARIDGACEYGPLERLALSTQSGVGSNAEGNGIDWDAERAKLELVVTLRRRVAARVSKLAVSPSTTTVR